MTKKILIPAAILTVLTIGGITMAVQPAQPVKVPTADQAPIQQAPAVTIIPGPAPAPEVPVAGVTSPVTSPTPPPDSSPAPSAPAPDQPVQPQLPAPEPAPAPPAPVFTITPGTP